MAAQSGTAKMINCPCGYTVHGKDDDELVANAQKHVRTNHPDMSVTREQFLSMAVPEGPAAQGK